MSGEQETHVKFVLDPEEETQRSMRGFEHRKDLVRGIKFQKENDEMINKAHTEYGYTWLREESMSLETIEKLDLGVRLVLHGFLVFFHLETRSSEDDVKEDLAEVFDHFQKTPIPLPELGKKLKEHLALLSFVVVDNDYGLPINVDDAKSDNP